jgi:hypothetical protein
MEFGRGGFLLDFGSPTLGTEFGRGGFLLDFGSI